MGDTASTEAVGIIVNGATGGICTRQHLDQALVPIIKAGGLAIGMRRIMPRLLLLGRNPTKLAETACRFGLKDWTTDRAAALGDDRYRIFFDAGPTGARVETLTAAIEAGKHVYTEKPLAPDVEQARKLLEQAARAGLSHGVVEDKLHLPGIAKLRIARDTGLIGRIVNFRLDFGYWIFSGFEQPSQRPSWNYRKDAGGGLILDMYPHWRYIIEDIVGPIEEVISTAWTGLPQRRDEHGRTYRADAEDSTATLVRLKSGAQGVITSSWATRVRRDDLMTFQVDGESGSASAGLHRCWVQPLAATPTARFDPDRDHERRYAAEWMEMPTTLPQANGYRKGWESFLAHHATGSTVVAGFEAGIRDVQLAEACYRSIAERRWIAMQAH